MKILSYIRSHLGSISLFSTLAYMSLFSITHAEEIAQPRIIMADQVSYQPLNPARGDKSPQSGVLWGDIRQNLPTGTLIKFRDGFSSPPHIHNITYRGVVIRGEIHNDDPKAEKMWMDAGSFWTQPAGENHITAAKGENVLAFLEILKGPYLVKPEADQFVNGEHPINITSSNIIWLDQKDLNWITESETKSSNSKAQISFLWGQPINNARNGSFIKISKGFNGIVTTKQDLFHAVMIQGKILHSNNINSAILNPGSYIGLDQPGKLNISCQSDNDCILYVSTKGKYQISSQ